MDKDKIIFKTAQLIKKYGIKSLTIDDITFFLATSKSAIYTHFQNKEELIKESLNFINVDFETKINTLFKKKENPIKKLIEIYYATIDFIIDFHDIFFFDLKKNPISDEIIKGYQINFKSNIILPLLHEAKTSNYLIKEINIEEALEQYVKFINHYFVVFKAEDNMIIKKQIVIYLNKYLTEEHKKDYNYLLLE
ncbi:TetR/AcrR family transcriptional regulator [Flavobacterium sp. ZE23DGlu08]|uniref:TetR/AcrR family transcriptional regulator n=1 Tax=Flavobacterium sp. ZE23DGlu08 TaxID=3059026 RepID=UPI00265F9330|nr:TetR/AcrR family transcriptional regulator [Flavobacterium sp. ZE23DGlu08]WKL43091.1 TetR/AcrR family transcriptional regulator [Flavobacterium sp. ZE23DGlu08]